jgi:ribose-phosphate pyrophosphokinase
MENLIFSGRSNPDLTKKICETLKKKTGEDYQGKIEISNFPSGETFCQIGENVRGKNVYFVQSTSNPNEDMMELLLLIHTAKLASAKEIVAVIPYFSYARQDRKTKPRTPISSRLILDLLKNAGATRIITLDIHNAATQGCSSIPFDSLIPCNLLIDHFRSSILKEEKKKKEWKLAAPDLGSVKKIEKFSEVLGLDFCIVHKKRLGPEKVEQKAVIGSPKGKKILLIDDMSESLGTLEGAAKLLKEKGAVEVIAFVSHLPLTKSGRDRLKRFMNLDRIITTDSVPGIPKSNKVKIISISGLMADVISCTIKKESISGLFKITGF